MFDPMRRPNSTAVSRHFMTSAPVEVRFVLPPNPTSTYRWPMNRLSLCEITPKERRSIRDLWELIFRGQLNCPNIFPDAGFVTTDIQPQFWELGPNKTYLFSEMTVAELSGWIGNPLHNGYLHTWLPRALNACRASHDTLGPIRRSEALGLIGDLLVPFRVGVLSRSDMLQYGYEYYVNLLTLRKQLGVRVAAELQAELNRIPAEREVRNRLQRDYHGRVIPIAIEGWKKAGARNYTADEEMIVSSVITAIMTGQATIILTRDTDVFDQFIKLFELMTGDYACFRFGEVYAAHPDSVPMRTLRANKPTDMFSGNSIQIVEFPQSEVDEFPPYKHTPVHCFCVLVGNHKLDPRISIAGYCLEAEMQDLLRIKGSTGGKNSDRFQGKNIEVGTYKQDGQRGIVFTVCDDNMVDYEGVRVSAIDVVHVFKDDADVVRYVWD